MKTKSIGIVMIVLGIVMMIYTGFNYVTTKRVADIGPLKIDKEENHTIEWPPIVGAVLIVGGAILIATDKK